MEIELTGIDQLEEGGLDQVRTKMQHYNAFVQKKLKLLPPTSDLLLKAGGSLALLLSHLGDSLAVLDKREELVRNRIMVLDMLDSRNRSRMKGFEMFKLHLILFDKVKLLTTQRMPPDQKEIQNLVLSMHLSLLEAHFLLKNDILAPMVLFKAYIDLERVLMEIKELDTLQQKIVDKYL